MERIQGMKQVTFSIAFILAFIITGHTKEPFPVNFRVEKQAMSTPITPLEEIFFNFTYFERPVHISFDGKLLNMYFDNKETFLKTQVTKVDCKANFEDDEEVVKRFFYTPTNNTSDTIMLVVDYDIPYIQLVLPTKNSKGEKIGYTSFQKFIGIEEFASR